MIRKLFSLDNPIVRKLSIAVDVFFLNVVFLATSIPIINLVANMISLDQAIRELRAHSGHPYSTYLKGCKQNFFMGLKGLAVFAPLLIIAAFSLMWSFQMNGMFALYSRFCSLLGLTIWCVVIVTFVDYASRYDDKFTRSLYNAFRIGTTNTRPILAGIIILVIIMQTINPTGMLTLVYLASFGGIAALAWLNDFLFTPVYDKYLSNHA